MTHNYQQKLSGEIIMQDYQLVYYVIQKFMYGQRAKEGTILLPCSWNWADNRSHNLGKALGEGLDLLKNWSQLLHC